MRLASNNVLRRLKDFVATHGDLPGAKELSEFLVSSLSSVMGRIRRRAGELTAGTKYKFAAVLLKCDDYQALVGGKAKQSPVEEDEMRIIDSLNQDIAAEVEAVLKQIQNEHVAAYAAVMQQMAKEDDAVSAEPTEPETDESGDADSPATLRISA